MLQIKFLTSVILLCIICRTILGGSADFEWLLEDGYEKELLTLDETAIVLPDEFRDALNHYHAGRYRLASALLQKIRSLYLPDGRTDFVAFALAECYRQLGLHKRAADEYRFVLNSFPLSDKVPPSLYRLLEISARNDDIETADSITMVFQETLKQHALYSSALYVCGILFYTHNQFDNAIDLLMQIPQTSSRYPQGQFVIGLCFTQKKEMQNALTALEYVRKYSKNAELRIEAAILIGDIHYYNDSIPVALENYATIPRTARRYQYSLVKTARAHLDMGQYAKARDLARKFIRKYKNSDLYFEMASILEQAYTRMEHEPEALRVSTLIYRQILNARLVFEIQEEIDRLTDMAREWQVIEYKAISRQDSELMVHAENKVEKVKELEKRFRLLLNEIDNTGSAQESQDATVSHRAERRYRNILKKRIAALEDSITDIRNICELKTALAQKEQIDSVLKREIDSVGAILDDLIREHTITEHEHALVVKECFGGTDKGLKKTEDMQAKFVDWVFMKYQQRKEKLIRISQEIANAKKETPQLHEIDSTKQLSTQKKSSSGNPSETDREKIALAIRDERERLIEHIGTMLDVYPKNRFNDQILFRFAELYFDEAGDLFEDSLREYERRIGLNDTATLNFPEFDLEMVIRTYDRIIMDYPRSELADDACFYKALALQKQNLHEEANDALLELVEKYPESEYYVEANMNIGRYYFEHPRTDEGQGYKLAEEAYRKVLFYRNHPQYVQALYHLGWCYYMQDRYEEAIAVFKYLVEETDLDFDPSKMEDTQISNPLLRGEAIDYIAISFDEDGRVEDAVKFLQLIGNIDYAALVLKRIGELREEDLDFEAACAVYRRTLQEYPLSTVSPEVTASLIKLYESREKPDTAMTLRESFFKLYSNGSTWQQNANKKDTVLVKKVDSMAISIGLYVADANYRNAEASGEKEAFLATAKKYRTVVETYSHDSRAAEARWNLAVILDTRLGERPQAFSQYILYSNGIGLDSSRREQAALNAIALAQSLLPPDSLVEKGMVDFAAKKVLEATENYMTLFPHGKSLCQVILNAGAVYFNRHMFAKALEQYNEIINKGTACSEYYQALLLSGQCHYGEEQWSAAISAFEKVWKEAGSEGERAAAYKLLLQSEFLNAKAVLNTGDYEMAAAAFRSIEQKYPRSEYGDIALFNAAESYEKMESWNRACENYYELARLYPDSKLAPDALFNAAANYEKSDKYSKAAETYELLIAKYSESERAKDALFNIGLCYEKTGKLDKMAEANERYSLLYPGEKDVEAMLLRSGAYYAKAGMYDKGITVYKNFVWRFPRSPKSVEALFMIAKCNYDKGDIINAQMGFEQAEQQNVKFAQENLETNTFYAAEAAFYLAKIKHEKFTSVKLSLPEELMKTALKNKSDLLGDAAKAYQRVMQYQSEKMFEAAYCVGKLYEELADAWKKQERPKLDPIKSAVLEREILVLSSQLIQKSFIPYSKALEIAQAFDTLNPEQLQWVEKSETSLSHNFLQAGKYLLEAVGFMQSAPVPKEIREKPLHYYQYLKKLHETVAPMKEQVLTYYETVLKQIDSLKLNNAFAGECRNEYVYTCYLTGNEYDKLSIQILKGTQDLPKDLAADEREDLLFQLEDIVFELQDKAILAYETALGRLERKELQWSQWYKKIIEALARLNPDKYGSSFYQNAQFMSDSDWLVRIDSISGWNKTEPPQNGWEQAHELKKTAFPGVPGNLIKIWSRSAAPTVFIWKHLFLPGAPRDASVHLQTRGTYKLYINGVLTMSDTLGSDGSDRVDSATGITSLVKGGDNVIAIETTVPDSLHQGVAVLFAALVDTSQHFRPAIKIPGNVVAQKKNTQTQVSQKPVEQSEPVHKQDTESDHQFRTRSELMKTIAEYQNREKMANVEIKKERLEIQKLRIKREELDTAIRQVQDQISRIKASRGSEPEKK